MEIKHSSSLENEDNSSLLGGEDHISENGGGGGGRSSLGRGNRKRKRRKFFDDEDSKSKRSAAMVAAALTADGASALLKSEDDNGSKELRGNDDDAADAEEEEEEDFVETSESLTRKSVFLPGYLPNPCPYPETRPIAWVNNSEFLRAMVPPDLTYEQALAWSPAQVANFVSSLPCLDAKELDKFVGSIVEGDVDGESFLMLNQADLSKLFHMKLGPAIKVYHSIVLIKAKIKS